MDFNKQIDDYIKNFPEETQIKMHQLRELIHQLIPDAVEKISYQMPTYFWGENVIHFAAYKKHIGFYPTPSAILEFEDKLTNYKTSKGAIQFPLDENLPLNLIKDIIEFRVKEVKKKIENNRGD